MGMTEIDNAFRQLRQLGMEQTLSTRAIQVQASKEFFGDLCRFSECPVVPAQLRPDGAQLQALGAR